MGDRANIVIEKDNSLFPHPVFFYTHWRGSSIKSVLQSALKRGRDRWNDSQYLSRVIFCELVKDDDGITGYGITTAIGDDGHRLLCVHMEENKVRERGSSRDLSAPVVQEWTFEEFCQAKFGDEEDE